MSRWRLATHGSHSRKVSINGRISRQTVCFMVLYGTLFVARLLRVTGNILRRLHCFHLLVDIPQMCPTWVTFAEGVTVFQLSTPERLPVLRYQEWRNVDAYTGWAKKTGPLLNVNNLTMVSGRKACDMSKSLHNFDYRNSIASKIDATHVIKAHSIIHFVMP